MRVLPSDPLPYADFIVRKLMQPVAPDGSAGLAVSETEFPILGDRWFWADDNAKILEFLSLPAVWREHPEAVTHAFRFLTSLCEGPFIFRRTGHARLEQAQRDGGRARFIHTFLHVECDLPAGSVTIGTRFHDGRDARNVILTGNYVHFVHDGVFFSLDVEDAISGWDIEQDAGRLRLSHRSELTFLHGGRRLRLGQLTYSYVVQASSMFVDAEAVLELDPAISVSDVVLTIGQDGLSHGENGVQYGTIFIDRPGSTPHRHDAATPGHNKLAAEGTPYWSIVQSGEMRGFALAVHTMPRDPGRIARIEAVSEHPHRLHWVVAQYRFPGTWRGERLVAAERKTITGGGFYDRVADCSAMFRAHGFSAREAAHPLDLSISYDYGAEMAAFARCYRGAGQPDMPRAALLLRDQSRAMFDHFYEVYAENLLTAQRSDVSAIFSRPLAFVAYGLVDMWKATGEEHYRRRLRQVVDTLLEFERPFRGITGETESGFLMGMSSSALPYVDCHAAAILALVRALPVLDDAGLAASIDRALHAFQIQTMGLKAAHPRKSDLLVVNYLHSEGGGARVYEHAFWNFCAALSLRAFKALNGAAHPALRQVAAQHATRLQSFESLIRTQFVQSIREEEGLLEIRTSAFAAESNSETQPWVALSLATDSGDD
ncbi:glycoside hydrolase family protein [Belnapia moabensis]|uniref:hypothetical protein n=1 Tax=Belnapia moabensis TaxID=365533 RepID=UPI0012EE865D|nr:hypothetical protein [Belnapia moabensis]